MAQVLIRPYQSSDFSSVVEIFWETSARQNFSSPQEREEFQQHYLTQYLATLCLVAEIESRVVGYVIASLDSQKPAGPELFADQFAEFPAHLHINCRADVRGQGVGALLIESLEEELKRRGVKGVHLVTLKGARNVNFYLKQNFAHIVTRSLKDRHLVLLGKKLSG
jgi:GNAT superfamily N-acetyltransferase